MAMASSAITILQEYSAIRKQMDVGVYLEKYSNGFLSPIPTSLDAIKGLLDHPLPNMYGVTAFLAHQERVFGPAAGGRSVLNDVTFRYVAAPINSRLFVSPRGAISLGTDEDVLGLQQRHEQKLKGAKKAESVAPSQPPPPTEDEKTIGSLLAELLARQTATTVDDDQSEGVVQPNDDEKREKDSASPETTSSPRKAISLPFPEARVDPGDFEKEIANGFDIVEFIDDRGTAHAYRIERPAAGATEEEVAERGELIGGVLLDEINRRLKDEANEIGREVHVEGEGVLSTTADTNANNNAGCSLHMSSAAAGGGGGGQTTMPIESVLIRSQSALPLALMSSAMKSQHEHPRHDDNKKLSSTLLVSASPPPPPPAPSKRQAVGSLKKREVRKDVPCPHEEALIEKAILDFYKSFDGISLTTSAPKSGGQKGQREENVHDRRETIHNADDDVDIGILLAKEKETARREVDDNASKNTEALATLSSKSDHHNAISKEQGARNVVVYHGKKRKTEKDTVESSKEEEGSSHPPRYTPPADFGGPTDLHSEHGVRPIYSDDTSSVLVRDDFYWKYPHQAKRASPISGKLLRKKEELNRPVVEAAHQLVVSCIDLRPPFSPPHLPSLEKAAGKLKPDDDCEPNPHTPTS